MSVRTQPGHTEFAMSPFREYAPWRYDVNALSPAFEMPYAGPSVATPSESEPEPLLTLTTREPRFRRRRGRAARVSRTGPTRLTAMTRSTSAAGPAPWFDAAAPPAGFFNPSPVLFGRTFDGPMAGHGPGMPWHYDLHVWIWAHNPSGTFAQFNPAPNVTCVSTDG